MTAIIIKYVILPRIQAPVIFFCLKNQPGLVMVWFMRVGQGKGRSFVNCGFSNSIKDTTGKNIVYKK